MKLRTRGNSIRLRLLQTEVKILEETGEVIEIVSFPLGKTLSYTLKLASNFNAQFEEGEIVISIPKQQALAWIHSEELSLKYRLPINSKETLSLLIEKDLTCLTVREGDEDKDTFPNPAQTC